MVYFNSTSKLDIQGKLIPTYESILSEEACNFIGDLATYFAPRCHGLLAERTKRYSEFCSDYTLDFSPKTADIRNAEWKVGTIPNDLLDRRVELVGPADYKIILNGLNSNACSFIADFEDALVPTWENLIQGQLNLQVAINGTLIHNSPAGQNYSSRIKKTVIMMRPRGLHLPEKHMLLNLVPIPGALLDFGLYFFNNANKLCALNTAPYFYLPKLENHLEARLWNDIFIFAQEYLNIPRGTIRATVVIETLPAAFEMDEILFELREHAAGLLYGCWDYIFSFIKYHHKHPSFAPPDRNQITKKMHFLKSFSQLLIDTCHRRGAHAIGSMTTQLPDVDFPLLNGISMEKIKEEKEAEAKEGYDGTWIGHPMLVQPVRQIFEKYISTRNYTPYQYYDTKIASTDLLELPIGTITFDGLHKNINITLYYLENWLRGHGSIRHDGQMEGVATVEIARIQIWQWIHHSRGILDDGRKITTDLYSRILDNCLQDIRKKFGEKYSDYQFDKAVLLLNVMTHSNQLLPFLTLEAYKFIEPT